MCVKGCAEEKPSGDRVYCQEHFKCRRSGGSVTVRDDTKRSFEGGNGEKSGKGRRGGERLGIVKARSGPFFVFSCGDELWRAGLLVVGCEGEVQDCLWVCDSQEAASHVL